MEKHILSKSTFIKGYHCLKSLYLHKKRPFLRDKLTAEQRAKFKRGHAVGDLAQDIFPGGIDVSPKSPSQYQKSAIRTQELIAEGQEIIYEATFQHEQVLVMLDILVKKEGVWHAYEVKSSKKLSETYYTDAALQYWVIVNSGLELASFSLVYVDENYRLKGDLDLKSYFLFEDVTEDIKGRQQFIGEKIAEEKVIINEKHSPKLAVGDHCFAPYKCDFVGFCWKKIADKPYVAEVLELEKLNYSNNAKPLFLGFIWTEQAIPLNENEKAYAPLILGFKAGGEESMLLNNSKEGKRDLAEKLLSQSANYDEIVVFEKAKMIQYLEELIILYPDLAEQAQLVISKMFGCLDFIVDEQMISKGKTANYTMAWFSKTYFENDSNLHKLAVYSDILARELFDKSKKDLLSEMHPDLESLKEYVSAQQLLVKQLYQRLA